MNEFFDIQSKNVFYIVLLFTLVLYVLYSLIKLMFLIIKYGLREEKNKMKNKNKKYENIPIVFEDGSPYTEDRINVLVGYQIIHKLTGRILPHTDRNVIYGKHAAHKKIREVSEFYSLMNEIFPIDEYTLEPIYVFNSVYNVLCDEPISGYLIEYDEKDIEEHDQY
jgi:hypothetical protein